MEEVLFRAEEARSGSSSYNLACLYAYQGKHQEARIWLEKLPELAQQELERSVMALSDSCDIPPMLPPASFLLEDPDLAPIREETWFRDIVAHLLHLESDRPQ